jgi:hypothetical protein
MSEEDIRREYASLADLPGIGERKAQWMREAGIEDLDALRTASIDKIAHVRGVGYLLAARLKEIVGDGPDTPRPSKTASHRIWVDRTSTLCSDILSTIDELCARSEPLSLSDKFVRQLRRARKVVAQVPVNRPPDDAKQRRRITKHGQALSTLVDSALKLQPSSTIYQKTLIKRLRKRRKKLEKWL